MVNRLKLFIQRILPASKSQVNYRFDILEQRINRCFDMLEQQINDFNDTLQSDLEQKILSSTKDNGTLLKKVEKSVLAGREEVKEFTCRKLEEKTDKKETQNLKKETQNLIDRNRDVMNKYISNTKSELYREIRYEFLRGLSPDKFREALCEWYYNVTQERLDLENPKTFNQKIQWLKLYDSTPLKTQLADKYEVRNWVKKMIGEEYLIPLLGVWDRFEDIDFDALPDQFVLKANHGCGWNIIVQDKKKFDVEDARKKFRLWMGRNYAYHGFEFHYKDIVPKIIAEQYMEFEGQLNDYKFICTNGSIRYIWVDTDRYGDHRRTIFNTDWEQQNFRIVYPAAENSVPKPDNFDKMKALVAILCKDFALVRVDLYNKHGKIYFGEMTFTSGNGTEIIDPPEYNEILGEMINLPEASKGKIS